MLADQWRDAPEGWKDEPTPEQNAPVPQQDKPVPVQDPQENSATNFMKNIYGKYTLRLTHVMNEIYTKAIIREDEIRFRAGDR